MIKMNLNPQDFKPLFHGIITASFLNCEIFGRTSLARNKIVILYTNGLWSTFIDREGEEKCLQEGVRIFSNPQEYQKVSTALRHHIDHAQKHILSKYSQIPEKMTKEEFVSVVQFLENYWYWYGFTEFPHHNLAFQKKEENPVITPHLHDLYEAKVEGRKVMSQFFFLNGVIPNIVCYFSRKYFHDDDSARYLSYQEILDLFDGEKPNMENILKRKECIALLSQEGEISEIPEREAGILVQSLLPTKMQDSVTGTIANKGKVTGKVVIAPMFNDMSLVQKVFDRMEDGAILIAQTTSPELMALCSRAKAIVADQGGLMSHAAVVSRELGIPCIVGTNYGTKIFKDGDLVEVDAEKGTVRKIP